MEKQNRLVCGSRLAPFALMASVLSKVCWLKMCSTLAFQHTQCVQWPFIGRAIFQERIQL